MVMVNSALVTALYQMCLSDGTHGLAPIDAVVCPEAQGHLPDGPDSETRGSHGSRMVVSKSTTHGFFIFGIPVSCLSVYLLLFYLSLCRILESHPVYLLCDATARCLLVQRNRLSSTKNPVGFTP